MCARTCSRSCPAPGSPSPHKTAIAPAARNSASALESGAVTCTRCPSARNPRAARTAAGRSASGTTNTTRPGAKGSGAHDGSVIGNNGLTGVTPSRELARSILTGSASRYRARVHNGARRTSYPDSGPAESDPLRAPARRRNSAATSSLSSPSKMAWTFPISTPVR